MRLPDVAPGREMPDRACPFDVIDRLEAAAVHRHILQPCKPVNATRQGHFETACPWRLMETRRLLRKRTNEISLWIAGRLRAS
jgi:hypothetical protein